MDLFIPQVGKSFPGSTLRDIIPPLDGLKVVDMSPVNGYINVITAGNTLTAVLPSLVGSGLIQAYFLDIYAYSELPALGASTDWNYVEISTIDGDTMELNHQQRVQVRTSTFIGVSYYKDIYCRSISLRKLGGTFNFQSKVIVNGFLLTMDNL